MLALRPADAGVIPSVYRQKAAILSAVELRKALVMFGKFLDTSHICLFADEVARQLAKDLPPAVINDDSKKGAKRRQFDKQLMRKIDHFKESVQLNIYQKAKIGPLLQDALQQAGYPADFSKAFSYEVVKLIALRSAGA